MKTVSRLAACTALSVLSLSIAPAYAQTAPAPAKEEEAEIAPVEEEGEIIVTGTRIPSPQFEGNIPGAQITAQDFEARGFTSVLEALNDSPLVGPGASPIGNAGGQPASLGASFVDLLDLGTQRTLTLVNGRRFVSGNAGSLFVAANASGGQVDLNSIPTEFVERTDVLTVGGAVAYGADAIAGVVNVILKDNYKGVSLNARSGITSRGDGFNYQLGGSAGTSFAGGRGNIALSLQFNHDDGIIGSQRSDIAPNFIAPNFFGNGGARNPSFGAIFPQTNSAFLPAATDGVPGTRLSPAIFGGSILTSESGTVFQYTPAATPAGTTAGGFSAVVAGNTAGALFSVPGATTQLVPGTTISATASALLGGNNPAVGGPGAVFTRFAPAALPTGTDPLAVIQALAPQLVTQATGGTAAQRTALALSLLQANRPTPREYLAANPNTPLNGFLGSFVPAFFDAPNPDAASAAFLPRTAVPLRFDASGNLVSYNTGRVGPNEPGTLTSAPNGDYYNPANYTVVRTEQDRYIGNLIGHFDLTDNIRFYTENLFARVENLAIRNAATSNNINNTASETAVIVANLNNPFLSAQARNTLISAGVPTTGPTANLFVLSRVNQDILGDNEASADSTTFRTVNGFKGKFGLFGSDFRYDASFSYGFNKAKIVNKSLRDIEFNLALDAVRNDSGNIVCRVQTPGASTATPLGVVTSQLVRLPGPDGVLVEQIVQRVVTPSMVSGCQPLNIFGNNQMSQAAKDYVTFTGVARNKSEQMQASFTLGTSSLFELPGGGVGFATNAEWRQDKLAYSPSLEQQIGVGRAAGLAATSGTVKTIEGSIEARIPIFGEDFTIPLFQSLEFTPGVRFVKQDGNAPDVRRLSGALDTNEAKGKWDTLYTLGGEWKPIQDITVRGNITRSIRQPSVVELFLGNQSAFNTPVDPCTSANIGAGQFPANRRANCEQEVVRLGIAPDRASAATFLATNFVNSQGVALQGGFAGSPTLAPEKGKSWTVGAVLQPRFIKNLTIAADYISVEVRNKIIPTTLANAANFCYDSATFNDTSATLGVNTCNFYTREPATGNAIQQFNIQNGFASGFINLGALKVKAINGSVKYNFDIADIFGGSDKGKLKLTANAYHLINYITSPGGQFTDNQESAGAFARPKWETQLTGRYEKGGFFAQWTWNWQNATKAANGTFSAFLTIENQDVIDFPAFGVHDATIGADITDNFRLQLVARNIFDNQYAGLRGFANASSTIFGQGQVDQLGRRFQMTARVKF